MKVRQDGGTNLPLDLRLPRSAGRSLGERESTRLSASLRARADVLIEGPAVGTIGNDGEPWRMKAFWPLNSCTDSQFNILYVSICV